MIVIKDKIKMLEDLLLSKKIDLSSNNLTKNKIKKVMLIKRDAYFSAYDEDGYERLYSTTEVIDENDYITERLFATYFNGETSKTIEKELLDDPHFNAIYEKTLKESPEQAQRLLDLWKQKRYEDAWGKMATDKNGDLIITKTKGKGSGFEFVDPKEYGVKKGSKKKKYTKAEWEEIMKDNKAHNSKAGTLGQRTAEEEYNLEQIKKRNSARKAAQETTAKQNWFKKQGGNLKARWNSGAKGKAAIIGVPLAAAGLTAGGIYGAKALRRKNEED